MGQAGLLVSGSATLKHLLSSVLFLSFVLSVFSFICDHLRSSVAHSSAFPKPQTPIPDPFLLLVRDFLARPLRPLADSWESVYRELIDCDR